MFKKVYGNNGNNNNSSNNKILKNHNDKVKLELVKIKEMTIMINQIQKKTI